MNENQNQNQNTTPTMQPLPTQQAASTPQPGFPDTQPAEPDELVELSRWDSFCVELGRLLNPMAPHKGSFGKALTWIVYAAILVGSMAKAAYEVKIERHYGVDSPTGEAVTYWVDRAVRLGEEADIEEDAADAAALDAASAEAWKNAWHHEPRPGVAGRLGAAIFGP